MRLRNIPVSHIIALILLVLAQILAIGMLSLEPAKLLFRRNVIYIIAPIPIGILYTLFLIPSILFLLIYIIFEFGWIELDLSTKTLQVTKLFRKYKVNLSNVSFIGRAQRRWIIWYMYAYYVYFFYYTWYWLIDGTGYEVFYRSFKSDFLGLYLNLGLSFVMLGLLPVFAILVLIIRPRLAVILNGTEIRFDVINRKKFLDDIKNVLEPVVNEIREDKPKAPIAFAAFFFILGALGFLGIPFGDFEVSIPFISLLFGTHELVSYLENYRGRVIWGEGRIIKNDRIWVFDSSLEESMKLRRLHTLMYIAIFFVILESIFSLFPLIWFPQYYTTASATIFLFIYTIVLYLLYMIWPFNSIKNVILAPLDVTPKELLNFVLISKSPIKLRRDLIPRLIFVGVVFLFSIIWLILSCINILPPLQTVF